MSVLYLMYLAKILYIFNIKANTLALRYWFTGL